jgi:Trypsin-like peptidase domain
MPSWGSLLLALAALVASAAASGCGAPVPRVAVAVPGPRTIPPPFRLALLSDAVVRVVGSAPCTGTLIADDRVLTAHVCVVDARGRDLPPGRIAVELGGDDFPWGEVGVRAVVSPDCGDEPGSGDGGIAILVLSRRLTGVPPALVRLTAPPERGDSFMSYGFGGCAGAGGAAHRAVRSSAPIQSVSPTSFVAPIEGCDGDQGGPIMSYRGEIIGVISERVAGASGRVEPASRVTRVDAWPQVFSAAERVSRGASPAEVRPRCEPAGDERVAPQ